MRLLLQGGLVADPEKVVLEKKDILIEGGTIGAVAPTIPAEADMEVYPLKEKLVLPGLVDIHTHLREPGFTHKETIAAGTRGAAKGGFTTVACMPNVNPPPDSVENLEILQGLLREKSLINAVVIARITRGDGNQVADIPALKAGGAVAVSDDGHVVRRSSVVRRALELCREAGIPLIEHCEDEDLARDGAINEGDVSRRLGVKGIPRSAEEVIVARDILLAAETGGPVHIAHISSARSVDLVRWAKERGFPVTSEVTPHHIALTDEAVLEHGAMAKMKPPLTTAADVAAIREGLADGTIDCIATDHAPHTLEEKGVGLEKAPFGIAALETALALVFTNLVHTGVLPVNTAVAKMTSAPARLLGLDRGTIRVGGPADLAVVDPLSQWEVRREEFLAKGQNTPFHGSTLRGKVKATLYGGEFVYQEVR